MPKTDTVKPPKVAMPKTNAGTQDKRYAAPVPVKLDGKARVTHK